MMLRRIQNKNIRNSIAFTVAKHIQSIKSVLNIQTISSHIRYTIQHHKTLISIYNVFVSQLYRQPIYILELILDRLTECLYIIWLQNDAGASNLANDMIQTIRRYYLLFLIYVLVGGCLRLYLTQKRRFSSIVIGIYYYQFSYFHRIYHNHFILSLQTSRQKNFFPSLLLPQYHIKKTSSLQ